jgi:hypothetical protein
MSETIKTGPSRLAAMVSRSTRRSENTLGIVSGGAAGEKVGRYRDPRLELYDSYYESRQYDKLTPWNEAASQTPYVPIRQRKPRVIYNFSKVLVNRVTAMLVGHNVFPTLKVEEDPMSEEYFKAVQNAGKLKHRIMDPTRHLMISGSVFIRFYLLQGSIRTEFYNSKHCYPQFQDNGELESVRIQYVYEDYNDKDERGKPKEKWYRLDLGTVSETLYDNPEYKANVEPQFSPVETVTHGLGFVQGEWFRTSVCKDKPDGFSLIEDIMGFIDELNYSLSQSSQAIGYNQDPQLAIKNMDQDEVETLIRSSAKAWNLGKDGEAAFVESSMNGVATAMDFRDRLRVNIQDIARVVMLDPEKIVGSAQSGKAMEILHGPMLELIHELRLIIEERLIVLVQKMGIAILSFSNQGGVPPFEIPKGFVPGSFNVTLLWPPVFPMTIEDLQKKVSVASTVASASLVSRETLTRWLAKDFGVEDIEEEIAKIAAQPILSPFGTF